MRTGVPTFRICSSSGKSHFSVCLQNLFQSNLEQKVCTLTSPAMTNQKMNCKINLWSRVDISESESNAAQRAICYNRKLHARMFPGRERRVECGFGMRVRSLGIGILVSRSLFSPERQFWSMTPISLDDTSVRKLVWRNTSFTTNHLVLCLLITFKCWRKWIVRLQSPLNEPPGKGTEVLEEGVQTQWRVCWTGVQGADFLGHEWCTMYGFPGGHSERWVWSLAGGHSFY